MSLLEGGSMEQMEVNAELRRTQGLKVATSFFWLSSETRFGSRTNGGGLLEGKGGTDIPAISIAS
jgi:hypothetical protein